jgi:hypothetical protein
MVELISSVVIIIALYDKKISFMDNIVIMIPLFFIYGLMYLLIKKNK